MAANTTITHPADGLFFVTLDKMAGGRHWACRSSRIALYKAVTGKSEDWNSIATLPVEELNRQLPVTYSNVMAIQEHIEVHDWVRGAVKAPDAAKRAYIRAITTASQRTDTDYYNHRIVMAVMDLLLAKARHMGLIPNA